MWFLEIWPFNIDELKTVKDTKRGKASGSDDIPSELLKWCGLNEFIFGIYKQDSYELGETREMVQEQLHNDAQIEQTH